MFLFLFSSLLKRTQELLHFSCLNLVFLDQIWEMISFSLVLDNSLSNKMFLRHFLCLSAMFLRHFGASFLHHCGANSPIFDEWFMDCYSRFKSINNLTLIPVRSISYRGRIQTNQMVGIISLLYIIRNWASLRCPISAIIQYYITFYKGSM